ncbi:unnamed protein product, partial [Oikopleura dioica]
MEIDGGFGRQAINQKRDDAADRVQKVFQEFLHDYTDDDGVEGEEYYKYKDLAADMISPEKHTFEIDIKDIMKWSQPIADRIKEDFYRLYPYLCKAVKNFCIDSFSDFNKKKDLFVAFTSVEDECTIRSLQTDKIGTLLRIKGQVVRTHPVHPELIQGCFICNDCSM